MSLEIDKVIGQIARMADEIWWRRENLEADRRALIFGNHVPMGQWQFKLANTGPRSSTN